MQTVTSSDGTTIAFDTVGAGAAVILVGGALQFGMPSGGILALEAANSGLAITRLALYEPPAVVDAARPPVPADYVEQMSRLAAQGERSEAVAYFFLHGAGVPADVISAMRQTPRGQGLQRQRRASPMTPRSPQTSCAARHCRSSGCPPSPPPPS